MEKRFGRQIYRWLTMAFSLSTISGPVSAQHIIGAKAGIIQYIEGAAYLEGKLQQPGQFHSGDYIQMKNGQILQTKQGRVELLLTPDSYLRMGEDGLLRLEQNELNNVQLSLERGSALIEVAQDTKVNHITLHYSKSVTELRKAGLYRLDADSGVFRAYGGEAQATNEKGKITVKAGRMIHLDGSFVLARFNADIADLLHKWAAQRSFGLVAPDQTVLGKETRWRLTAAGWLNNPDYRATFYSPAFYDLWRKNLNKERYEDNSNAAQVKAAADQAAALVAAQAAAAAAQAQGLATAQAQSAAAAAASQPSKQPSK
jgi:hypothetical protein